MNRRRFLKGAAQVAVSFPLLLNPGCAHRSSKRASSRRNSENSWRPLTDDFELQLPRLMSEDKVPGLSIAVIHDARMVWRRGFGVRDAATRVPVDHQTIFEAASMSKPVFAYLVLKLCEKGVLELDTPLSRYAAEPFFTGDPRLELITPRHLLSHSSGLPNWRSDKNPLKTAFDPGSQYRYSGEGYYYLQSVITHLTGKFDRSDCATFEDGHQVCATDIEVLLKRNILQPFGMNSSGYGGDDVMDRNGATGHDDGGKAFPKGKPTGPGIARYAAAGGLLSTPTDFARFMIEVLDPKAPDNYRLKKESIREMIRPQIKVVQGSFTSSWALGWQVQDNGLINHGGDNKGFHCHALASPKSRSGFVVMTNGDGGPALIQKLFARPTIDPFFGIMPLSKEGA